MSRPSFVNHGAGVNRSLSKTDLSAALERAMRPVSRDGGDPEGVAQHPDELIGLNASLHILVKDTADLLVRRFPGFLWAVKPDQRGGVIDIYCLNFSASYGYTIRLLELQTDPKMREVVRGGAEILRRFRYPGTRFDRELANNVPRGPDGEAIPDLSDKQRSRRRDRSELDLAFAQGKAEIVDVNGEILARVTGQ